MGKLSDKQKAFCNEYIIDFNGTQAAIRAGYSEKTANEQASRLLANVNVQSYLSELKATRTERVQVNQDDVLRELLHREKGFIEGQDLSPLFHVMTVIYLNTKSAVRQKSARAPAPLMVQYSCYENG